MNRTAILTTNRETRITRSITRTIAYLSVAGGALAGAATMPMFVPGVLAALLALPLVLTAILFGVAAVHATHRAECPACARSLAFVKNEPSEAPCDGCGERIEQSAGRVFVARRGIARHMRPEWQVALAVQIAAEAYAITQSTVQ